MRRRIITAKEAVRKLMDMEVLKEVDKDGGTA